MMKATRTYTAHAQLPTALQPLLDIAMNLGWLTDPRVQSLFARLDPDKNAGDTLDLIGTLHSAPPQLLEELSCDPTYVAQAAELRDSLERSLATPRWFQLQHDGELNSVAYLSAEFGIARALPQYSGGLGILAGDHLKAANELGIPLVGVGLLYRHGYFTQQLDESFWQREYFTDLEPKNMSLREIPGIRVSVDIAGRQVYARAWEARVGRVPLYLLDTHLEDNEPADRLITDRLYGGDQEQRLSQELVLGVGGVRLLTELGYTPQVFHLNEGHAVFSALERIRMAMEEHGLDYAAALESVRPSTLFTTHTPVPAGIDRFSRGLIEKYFKNWCDAVGIDIDDLMELGHEPHTPEGSSLNMAVLGLRLSEARNGVAQLHGEVSREMFHSVWPDFPVDEVPIGAVTNGVHARTWVMREMNDLIEQFVGDDWSQASPQRWKAIQDVSDEQLRSIRATGRDRLVRFARRRVRQSLISKGLSPSEAEWANEILDPNVLTIGFARRFATYKRADLLLRNERRLRDLLRDPDRPIQIIFAGKAHPADDPGKRILQRVAEFALDPRNRNRVVYLEDYDIEVGRYLYQGVDIWLNNPRRPLEACGTSGMKVVYNGGLNLSILDGWWAEHYAHDLGFSIPTAWWMNDVDERDERESQTLFRVLEDSVIPKFHGPDNQPLPPEWLQMIRNSMSRLGPAVESTRMMRDYVNNYYEPLAERTERFRADAARVPADLAQWKENVLDGWDTLAVLDLDDVEVVDSLGTSRQVSLTVDTGQLSPDDIDVQVLNGPVDLNGNLKTTRFRSMKPTDDSTDGGPTRFETVLRPDQVGHLGYCVRVVPRHPELGDFTSLNRVIWAK